MIIMIIMIIITSIIIIIIIIIITIIITEGECAERLLLLGGGRRSARMLGGRFRLPPRITPVDKPFRRHADAAQDNPWGYPHKGFFFSAI